MAVSTCGKCGSSSFEMKTLNPKGANFPVSAVQCEACGAVAGVMETINLGDALVNINSALTKKLGHMQSDINDIKKVVKQLEDA